MHNGQQKAWVVLIPRFFYNIFGHMFYDNYELYLLCISLGILFCVCKCSKLKYIPRNINKCWSLPRWLIKNLYLELKPYGLHYVIQPLGIIKHAQVDILF